MPQVDIPFENLNTSIQVGDHLYYSSNPNLNNNGFDTVSVTNTTMFGTIINVGSPILDISTGVYTTIITAEYDLGINTPLSDAFFSFVKDKKVNTSSLVGYYMHAKFENNSTTKAELFSVGSEVSESSK